MVRLEGKIYTLTEAASLCGTNRVTLWRWIKSGKLQAYQTPTKHYRIKQQELEYFIKNNLPYVELESSERQQKILIVDDEASFRKFVRKMLAGRFAMEEASSGFEAGLKVQKFMPSIVILDLYMPGIDGFEVCRMLKSDPNTRNIKIIAVTGMSSPEIEQQIRLLGADAYLAKPFVRKELMQCIEALS